MSKPLCSLAYVLLSLSALPLASQAQADINNITPQSTLRPVVVTATRSESDALDVPASIDRVEGNGIRLGRAQINISEGLTGVPGLGARDRQNYAQDVQIVDSSAKLSQCSR